MLNINFTPFPLLATNRLVLRKPEMDDAANIAVLRSDNRINKFLDRPEAMTTKEGKNFIKELQKGIENNECFYWIITLKNNNDLIGIICYWHISHKNESAEIGYELHPGFQGKGIMHEAMETVINWGFQKMQLKLITAFTQSANIKSARLLLKNNFKPDIDYKFAGQDEAKNLLAYYLIPPVEKNE